MLMNSVSATYFHWLSGNQAFQISGKCYVPSKASSKKRNAVKDEGIINLSQNPLNNCLTVKKPSSVGLRLSHINSHKEKRSRWSIYLQTLSVFSLHFPSSLLRGYENRY